MRLALSIAAWPEGADAADEPNYVALSPSTLPTLLTRLGFTVVPVAARGLAAGLRAALAGVEPTDTLLVHVNGVLADDGALEVADACAVPLSSVADALAETPCGRTLVFVEAAYRGVEDALVAVERVESVANALSSNAGSHTTVVAVHPMHTGGADTASLAFTRAVLDAARDVVTPDGVALVADAYSRARERQLAGGAASGFAFLRGGGPFPIGHALAVSTEREPRASAPPRSLPPPPSVAPPVSVRRRSSAPVVPRIPVDPTPAPRVASVVVAPVVPAVVVAPVAPMLPSVVVAAPAITPPAPVLPAVIILPSEPVVVPVPSEPATAPVLAPAATSGAWLEASDIVEAPSLEALDAKIAAANAAGDYRRVVQLSRERIPYLSTPEARVDELFEIGRTLAGKLQDLPEAVLTLEEARGIDAARGDVLEGLRRAYARLERWTEALEVTLSLAKRSTDAHERAALRVAAAEFACKHLEDEEYALELLEMALQDDPTDEAALAEVSRLRRSRGELVDLERTLAALANHLVDSGDPARAWDACQRLAAVRRDDLGDAAGAVEALALAKRLPLTTLDARMVLAEQLLALDDDDGAVAELDAIIAEQPNHARAHARLFAIHRRRGKNDRAYLSALALEELGQADAAAKEVLDSYRADWGLRARSSLDDAAWESLRAEGADEIIETVFRVTLRAALAAEIENRAEGPVLDPSMRQSETSTASIVRCFQWAARALGTPSPALYVLDEVQGGIAAVSAKEPTTALGPDVLRGLSSKTLAFLAGRHLTYFRPEYQVLVHFPTTEAAAGLLFAAIDLVAPGTYVPPSMSLHIMRAKHRLARHLRPDDLSALSAAVGRLEARDAKLDLLAWVRSVELTAGRAGLLLAGDLQTALAQVRSETHGLTGLGVDERRNDLLAFAASRTFADLRASYIGMTPASIRPPTTESAVVHRDDPSLRQSGERGSTRLMA
jgi:tetratricopeptide (TPR) repeat protein